MTDPRPALSIVIPTIGRPSLRGLLDALLPQLDDARVDVVVVDDRARPAATAALADELPSRIRVVGGSGRGPAAARNVGWRLSAAPWIAFLDDDVLPPPGWFRALLHDLGDLPAAVAGSQGRIVVPLPEDRRPTDWERNTAGLETAAWATADMAYRREVLEQLSGFDERFPRAFREDADLALRTLAAGWTLVRGERFVCHPVRPADVRVSIRTQAGNADDALMRRLHGDGWWRRGAAPVGRIRRHAAITAAATTAVGAAALGHRRLAAAAASAWLLGTAEFAWARIAPGPRTLREVSTMLVTSAAIPPLGIKHRLAGEWRWRHAEPWPGRLQAVLFDRDGTLVRDVPYNGDPEQVVPMPGARHALDRLRAAGICVGVVSNQSGVGRGLLTTEQVDAVNRRVEDLLGPFDTWHYCPHDPAAICECRKPQPGLVLRAADDLELQPWQCAVVGDIGGDVEAALRAGARPILIPTPVTRPHEVAAAPVVAPDLDAAVTLLLAPDRIDQPFRVGNVDQPLIDQRSRPDNVDQSERRGGPLQRSVA